MPSLNDIPCWFIVVAAAVSLFQAARGFAFQWILGTDKINGTMKKIGLLCMADALTYFLCASTGFYALFLLTWCWNSGMKDAPLTIFLALYALLGITGKLPELLHTLKFPGA
jgi:hypothetical protein